MAVDPKIERISQMPLFSGCSKSMLRDVARAADEVHLDEGEVLVQEGERLRHAYVLVSGSAAARVDGETVGTVAEGEVIGELAMFDPAPATATVVATGPTELLAMEQGAFEQIVRADPDLAVHLLRTLARRFHGMTGA